MKMTRIENAKKGIITEEVKTAALIEGVSAEKLSIDIAEGKSVIARNNIHNIKPLAIGKDLKIKVNANIGTSKDKSTIDEEIEKLKVLVKYGADAVMDLSTGGPIIEIRKRLIEESPIPLGTVPIYEAAVEGAARYGSIIKMTPDDMFNAVRAHAEGGVDFVTIHCGLTMRAVDRLKSQGRILDIVSRGGALMLEWMIYNNKENPFYEYYDRLLELAHQYDLTLSLGDAMRPGCLADATDRAQIEELSTLGELQARALDAGVQVIIEGPGHVPLNQVEMNMKLQKTLCNGAPFYILGPLVTDCGMGYDHISGAIGGAIAGAAGADFLCYVTPAEHIRLPDLDNVVDGLIASKIAGHAGDIARGLPSAIERDKKMARFRKNLDWEGQMSMSFNPDKVRAWRAAAPPSESDVCSMCSDLCAIKTVERALKKK
ncbi:MAG: phosphomethylpyrimidine synthase ThiC [Nitrospirae bacterium]|nr:phosphomethylpyrimidine synthase ThiC [Nitrospirota bacterium]